MSDSLAIAVVTETLRSLIDLAVNSDGTSARITAKPPDTIGNGGDMDNQVNIFLYQTMVNAAWRNMDMPLRVQPGETGHPPLALDLYYIVTAYGAGNNDVNAHQLLGKAMNVLHDHPLLSADEILDTVEGTDLEGSNLHLQIERVRITPHALSLDDMSKLWNAFQTQYRISAAYRVAVVLIDSSRSAKTPLPVLRRGPTDEGAMVQPNLIPPYPILTTIKTEDNQSSVSPGVELALTGLGLTGNTGDTVIVQLSNPLLDSVIELDIEPGGTSEEVKVIIPDDPPNWVAGFYNLAAVIRSAVDEEPDITTNQLPLSLAALITTFTPKPAILNADHEADLQVQCNPQVRPEQRAVLLIGDREVLAREHPNQTNELSFLITDVDPGSYYLRLRIDGVDSLLIDLSGDVPAFDETKILEIQ